MRKKTPRNKYMGTDFGFRVKGTGFRFLVEIKHTILFLIILPSTKNQKPVPFTRNPKSVPQT